MAFVIPYLAAIIFDLGVEGFYAIAIATVFVYAAEAYILAKAAEALAPKPPTGAGRGYEVAITDTGADGLAIFGTVRVSGVNVIPAITGGTNGRYLEQVIALAVHPVSAFGYVGVDDLVIGMDYITAVTGTINDGLVTGIPSAATVSKYNNKLSVRCYLGSSSQAVDWILNNRYPTTFTSDFRGRGYPYAAMTYDWAEGKLWNGVPRMTFLVSGAAMYDPRLDSTNGGTGAQRYNDTTTWTFSVNPALGWARLLMASFGGRVDPTAINWPSVIAAANVCDAFVSAPVPFVTLADTANATHDATNNFYRVASGGNAWGLGTYSSDGYNNVSLSGAPYNLALAQIFGLHTSAVLASSSTIAYGWYTDNTQIIIYEASVAKLTIARAPTASDHFRIDYDGANVYYYLNDQLQRSVAVATAGQSLYLNVQGYNQGAGWTLGLQRRYTFNARLNVAQDWRNNARYFVDAMLGRMVRRGTTYFIYAGAWTAPSFTVGKSDWLSIDSIKVSQQRDGGHWNTARVWYVDPTRNWQRVECFARRNATYKAADGGEEIPIQIEQSHCTSEYEAQRKGEFMLRRSRNQIVMVGALPPRFRYVATGDVGSFTFEELGWASKSMRVMSMELGPDGSVKVSLAEEQAADWTDLTISQYNAPSTSVIPAANPTTPSEPQNFVLQSLAGTLIANWDLPLVRPIGTRFRIITANSPGNAAIGSPVWEGDTNFATLAVADPSTRFWWVQGYVNSYYGPYQPNTSGVLGRALPVDDNTFSQRVFIDEDFQYDFGSRHWWITTPTFLVSSAELIPNAGIGLGGVMRFYMATNSGDAIVFIPKRVPPQVGLANQVYGFAVRFMRAVNVVSGTIEIDLYHTNSVGVYVPESVNNVIQQGRTDNKHQVIINVMPASVGSNWHTAHGFLMGPASTNLSYPFLRPVVVFTGRGGVFDIDKISMFVTSSLANCGTYYVI